MKEYYNDFFKENAHTFLRDWEHVEDLVVQKIDDINHGEFDTWRGIIDSLPKIHPQEIMLDSDEIHIGNPAEISSETRELIEKSLRELHPWRKGPFNIFGIHIDSEWRCEMKWNRLKDHVDLKDKTILDVGCGNGYYGWRMLGAGAKLVVGIDPTLYSTMQFHAINHFIQSTRHAVLPLRVEDLPDGLGIFDTVFSMGVLYHRHDVHEHLQKLRGLLKPGGKLVLETLVIEGEIGDVLNPENRYAKMKNVYSLPSAPMLVNWLEESSYENIRVVDVSKTTTQEQRSTDWMKFDSLETFLDSSDHSKTVEGHPAPLRAIIISRRN